MKDKMRSTMTEIRLNGLTLVSEHRDVVVTPEEVLDIFCRKNRLDDFIGISLSFHFTLSQSPSDHAASNREARNILRISAGLQQY
ncbi:hypothetical protein SKAU_G00065160, partial [Synaphobranchus kaupii]